MVNTIKKFYQSKTFWVGVAACITSIGMYFTGEQNLQELFLGVNGVVMIALRFITNQPIEKPNLK